MECLQQIVLVAAILAGGAVAQDTHVSLNQGIVVGLKVFPETSRTPVYTFLGIPYAEPPVKELRFALPRSHAGWNQTYFAKDQKPLCPQLTNSIYDETADRAAASRPPYMDEDCLYLNIWTPEAGLRYGNLPVLVIITGEEMSFDWPQNRPTGLDLASEGIVVVVIQYRTNIFGWLGVNSNDIPGNFGFYDQNLALKWTQHNIHKFGGNPKQVTILGHGTTGAVCTLIHLTSPKSDGMFTKAIIMSGTSMPLKQIKFQSSQTISLNLVQKLGCQAMRGAQIVNCLRTKSRSDLLKAYESIYRHGNYTALLGPIMDTFRETNDQHISRDPEELLRLGVFRKIPIMFGLCTNEGAFIRDFWVDLAREGFNALRSYVNFTTLPNILSKYGLTGDQNRIVEAINWRYFDQYPKSSSFLLNSLQRLISEAEFEAPFYETLELLSRGFQDNSKSTNASQSPPGLFVYAFQQPNSMDMRGKVNLFGGASHSSDLPLIMGPSLFQQIARRRFTGAEDKLCRKLRQLFTDFMKTGNPTPGRIYDAWHPYTKDRKFIKLLGDPRTSERDESTTSFEDNLSEIEEMLQKNAGSSATGDNRDQYNNPYQLGSRELNAESRRAKASYLVNKMDYEYYNHLKKVYSFWYVLLPSIYAASNLIKDDISSTERSGREIAFIDTDAIKYKHAFFSMLSIVCLLLGILGICVYILKKNHPSLSSNL